MWWGTPTRLHERDALDPFFVDVGVEGPPKGSGLEVTLRRVVRVCTRSKHASVWLNFSDGED
jgi:hypothetical protein